MPTVEANYATYNDETIGPAVDEVVAQFEDWGLAPIGNIIDQVYAFTDYLIIEVVFAYLDGSLTSNSDYA